ncbi:sigma-70 family RNA polymerase sigma factor [Marinilabilia rubra]|uniref:RNA polymerase subunit sigma n=1 Tax=Marinilabilia rubra TaxID=2162893 RepID=A0A2U2BED1_9BACT|nr:RNA polymerase sigma factor RpoD/SigA [Marinilabilia rubra]PWE01436.1 RNA polymerase subunit sigma [Marinilabilia rubra]
MRQLKITKQITNIDSDNLSKYLYEISKIPRINPEDEVFLARKINKGDERALIKLVNANLRFVISVAKHYTNKGLSLSDLISEGNLGLIKAARKFDETRGFKFISYAVWWIRQSILQALSEHSRIVRLPQNKIINTSRVSLAFSELEQEFQREPSYDEVAELLDMHPLEVKNILKTMGTNRHESIDAPVAWGEEKTTRGDFMLSSNQFSPEIKLLEESLKETISNSLSFLSEKEARIVTLYFGLNGEPPHSLDSIGKLMKCTRERVRQIKTKALNKLKVPSRSKSLKAFL